MTTNDEQDERSSELLDIAIVKAPRDGGVGVD